MTIRHYDLEHGIVLVDSVTDLPLPITVYTFQDLDDADTFLAWATERGARRTTTAEVVDRAEAWVRYGRKELAGK